MILAALALTLAGPACDEGAVRIDTRFPFAGRHRCERTEEGFLLTVAPEATPINPSPWYAFDVISEEGGSVHVELRYLDSRHRYVPKKRDERLQWTPIPDAVTLEDDGRTAHLALDVPAGTTRIAAQPTFDHYDRRTNANILASRTPWDVEVAGRSEENRAIVRLHMVPEGPPRPLILLIGGQHPPEVPGALAMAHFLRTVGESDSHAARAFREQFAIVAFPTLNPDGIANGNWRYDMTLEDMNRDWSDFDSQGTRIVGETLSTMRDRGYCPVFMVDFHATRRDVLYTPADSANADPDEAVDRWIAAIEAGLGEEEGFAVDPGHNPGLPTAKTWFAETYGRPGVTLEIGDETDLERTKRLSIAAANGLMEVMTEQVPACG